MGELSNDGPASHLVKIWRQKSGPNDGPVVDQARGMALPADPATPKAARMPTHTKAAPTVDGGCVRCFRPREDNLFKLCARCRTMARKRYHQRKADRAKTAPAP